MMRRLDAMKTVYAELEGDDRVVVTIMGAVAAELQSLGHRPNFFYLQHAMGLASSMGLGIALSRPELKVVVFDGDGSVLMNLGGLTTLARYRPRNLVHVVFDNESLLSVGGFPTATSTGSDIAAIAARSLPVDVAVGNPPTDSRLSLSNTTCTRFFGRDRASVVNPPRFISTEPSPSRTITWRSGRVSAMPSPIDEARPIACWR